MNSASVFYCGYIIGKSIILTIAVWKIDIST